MEILLVVIVLIILFGGGTWGYSRGWYGRRSGRPYPGTGFGVGGLISILMLMLFVVLILALISGVSGWRY